MPQILSRLHEGKFDEVKRRLQTCGSFAYEILRDCVEEKLEPKKYAERHRLNFKKSDFTRELGELITILLVLEDRRDGNNYETVIAATLLECVQDASITVNEDAKGYPGEVITATTWMNGFGLRYVIQELADYFERKKDDERGLQARFTKAKVTLSIMSHYPNEVGPDMNALASKYEKMGDNEKARQFYAPVVKDFTPLVLNIESRLEDLNEPDETDKTDFDVTLSLVDALLGLKRISAPIDEDLLTRSLKIHESVKLRLESKPPSAPHLSA